MVIKPPQRPERSKRESRLRVFRGVEETKHAGAGGQGAKERSGRIGGRRRGDKDH